MFVQMKHLPSNINLNSNHYTLFGSIVATSQQNEDSGILFIQHRKVGGAIVVVDSEHIFKSIVE